ncbi:MAG TPA: hypothetical protein VLU46_03075 [Thermoanaerobaculia bacterium]|nr:hypothetical protein [Thermoanaerobaculia bacterium]
MFSVPDHGVGWVTVHHYPKGWDYAVVVMLFAAAAIVTGVASRFSATTNSGLKLAATPKRPAAIVVGMLLVFLAILPARDQPFEFADPYHEGENLSGASVLLSGGHPYKDFWLMHGVATDGGLDALVAGDPPSMVRTRRMHAFLSAAAVALLVPIAAEVCSTWTAVVLATVLSLCGIAAGQLPATPHFRLLPLLAAVWCALIFIRTGKRAYLIAASAIASAGLLWSLDIGLFAVAGLWSWLILTRRIDWRAIVVTVVTPIVLLLLTRSDIGVFFKDSFRRLPECFDAIYSLPAPPFRFTAEAARYYTPPIVYGAIAAAGFLLRRDAMLLIVFTAFFELRSASGRYSWGHLRFSVPLLGIVIVALAIEPLVRSREWKRLTIAALIAIAAVPYFEVMANAKTLANDYATYSARLRPKPGTVRAPLPRAHDYFTYPQEAHDLGALYEFSQSMPAGPMFDYSGEKYLYYMLARPPSTRCQDIPYMSDPKLLRESLQQLERRPPVFVVVSGHEVLANIDGVSNRERTPQVAEWIDRRYPRRITIGRYTVGLPSTP